MRTVVRVRAGAYSSVDFLNEAVGLVSDYASKANDAPDDMSNVFTVWYGYVLGNMKALFGTTFNDGRYYEVTFSRETSEVYLDVYVKEHNESLTVSSSERSNQ